VLHIGTPLTRHASLTLQVSASALRNVRALVFDQSRRAAFRSCGLFALTSTSFVFRTTSAPPNAKRAAPHEEAGPNRNSALFNICTE